MGDLIMPFSGGGNSPVGGTSAATCTIKNVSGETIPAFAFVKVSQLVRLANGKPCVEGAKPDDSDDATYVVNGRAPIADGEYGSGFWIGEVPVWVKVDDASSLEPVQVVGPEDDSWLAASDGEGFSCVGVDESLDLAAIVRIGGGGGGTGSGGGGGNSACVCAGAAEVGAVAIGGVLYARSYSFNCPVSGQRVVVVYDEDTGIWVSDLYEYECPEDEPPEEEE